jgi:hypothetical protein
MDAKYWLKNHFEEMTRIILNSLRTGCVKVQTGGKNAVHDAERYLSKDGVILY